MEKTLGQIAHEAGEKAGGWSRKWEHLSDGQRAEWEAIAEAVVRHVRVALEPVVMPHRLHTVTINTLADMEACCRRWRELGATDETKVVIENNFTLDVTGTLQEHYSSGQLTITLDQFPA